MWRLSGIFRDVYLWSAPQVHIRDYFVKTDLCDAYIDGELSLQLEIERFDETARMGEIEVVLFDREKEIKGQISKPFNQDSKYQFVVPLKNPNKWSAEIPYLYQLAIILKNDAGDIIEIIGNKIGFRKIEIKNAQLHVNGRTDHYKRRE